MMRVSFNGTVVEVPDGSSISCVNGRIVINGNACGDQLGTTVHVAVSGNVGDINLSSGSVVASGVARSVRTSSGDVTVHGSVGGDVTATSGDIQCGDVAGSVRTTSGDILKR